jgi:hypothetical protein
MGTQRHTTYCCDWHGCKNQGTGSVPKDWAHLRLTRPTEANEKCGSALLCPEHYATLPTFMELLMPKESQ